MVCEHDTYLLFSVTEFGTFALRQHANTYDVASVKWGIKLHFSCTGETTRLKS